MPQILAGNAKNLPLTRVFPTPDFFNLEQFIPGSAISQHTPDLSKRKGSDSDRQQVILSPGFLIGHTPWKFPASRAATSHIIAYQK